jgi:hypothetical protein
MQEESCRMKTGSADRDRETEGEKRKERQEGR